MVGNNNNDQFTGQVWLPLVLGHTPPGYDKAGGLRFGAVLWLEQVKHDCAAFFEFCDLWTKGADRFSNITCIDENVAIIDLIER